MGEPVSNQLKELGTNGGSGCKLLEEAIAELVLPHVELSQLLFISLECQSFHSGAQV